MIKRMLTLVLALTLALALALPAFAAQLYSGEAKDVFKLLNSEREEAGLSTLKWDNDLAEAAEVRALEICEKYTADHSRPNGQSFFSVSTKVWGENTAYGYKNAQAAMTGWMKSKGHKENILRDTFTIGAVACAQANDGTMYWVQLFGNGKSNASWAVTQYKITSYTFDPFNDSSTKTTSSGSESSSASASASLLDKEGKVTATGAGAQLKKAISASNAKDVSLRIKNAAGISPAVLKSLATTASASGKTLSIQADTMSSTGKSVQGRLVLEPAKLTGRKTTIQLGVYTTSSSVADIQSRMEKKYDNTMAYIHMEHIGSLTVPTKVVAKVKLTGLDTGNLQFYVYNSKKDTLIKIETPNYSVDSKGFVTFYTSTGGDIVILDKALSK